MRKIIIPLIATIVLIATFEKAKGQDGWTSADFPTINVLTGLNANLSFGIWRFEPFLKVGGYLQMFEESTTTERTRASSWSDMLIQQDEFYSSRFLAIFDFGTKFMITDRNRIEIGWIMTDGVRLGFGTWWQQFYLGYIHRVNLSHRVSLDFNVRYGFNWLDVWFDSSYWRSPGRASGENYDVSYQFASLGARLNYEIFRNLNLNVQLGYTRRYNVRYAWTEDIIESVLTRNLINFSIGITTVWINSFTWMEILCGKHEIGDVCRTAQR